MTSRVSGLHPSCPLAAAVRSLQLSVRCCPVRRNGVRGRPLEVPPLSLGCGATAAAPRAARYQLAP